MKSTGPVIKSVSSLASSAQTSSGSLKSNNGIEKSKSAIQGKEKSEAILETMFAFEAEHAREFAQRELDDDMRSWKRMADRTMIENISMQQNAIASQTSAGIFGAGLAGIGGGIAAFAANNNSGDQETNSEGQVHSQQENFVAQTNTWQKGDSKVMDATDPDTYFS